MCPNYCTNSVHVKAEPKSIAIIVSAIKGRGLFESLIPQDKDVILDGLLEDYYGYSHRDVSKDGKPNDYEADGFKECPYKQLWYNFRNKYWGSKRDIVPDIILYRDYNIEKGDLHIDYDSAWCPQLEGRQYISELLNAKVHIEFSEPGMGFSGKFDYKDGEEIHSEEWSEDPYYGHGKECPTCGCFCDDENPDDWLDEKHTRCVWCDDVLDTNHLQHED